ncbi:unnamed protein product [Gordionus sp. m RMFG-2023]|uniref:large neutral amino acids transporter small subunit 1-like n=1 Tax=Gordionus sp. m RMFG-2023 TaxID=3053472 RepID=UPI0030E599B3
MNSTAISKAADDSSQHSKPEVKLLRHVTLMDGVAILVGSMIGSGIFITPTSCLKYAGSPGAAILIWFASGCLAMLGALSFAELGTTITSSGGEAAYIKTAFGSMPTFLFIWVNVLVVRPVIVAIVTVSFGEYVIGPFIGSIGECDSERRDQIARFTAAFGLFLLMMINCYSVKLATKLQDVLTIAKLVALGVIITIGFVRLGQGHTENFKNPFQNTNGIQKISLAFYSGLFSFGGWNFLNLVTGEMKNPTRDLPLSILIGMPIVTAVYVLTNIAYLSVLSVEDMKLSKAVAFDFASKINYYLAWFMPIFAGLSAYGTANAVLFTSGRIYYIGAQNGHLPQILSMINIKWLTPMPSIIALTLISLFYMTGKDIISLINFMSFIFYFFTAMCVVGLLYLRWKKPDIPRPIKLNVLIHLAFLLSSAFILITSLISDYKDISKGLLMLLLGIPVYYLFVKKYLIPRSFFKTFDKFTKWIQMLFVVVPSEEKENDPLSYGEETMSPL